MRSNSIRALASLLALLMLLSCGLVACDKGNDPEDTTDATTEDTTKAPETDADTEAPTQGETEADTARREILEETGLTAIIDTSFRQVVTYYPKPGVVKDVIFFLATVVSGTERAQEEEIAEIQWFSFQEARDCITYASDEEVLLAAHARLLQSGD